MAEESLWRQYWKKQMDKSATWPSTVETAIFFLYLLGLILGACFFFVYPTINASGTMRCNVGHVGFELDGDFYTQNYTLNYRNLTYFDQEILWDSVKIKDFDNIECYMDFDGKVPYAMVR